MDHGVQVVPPPVLPLGGPHPRVRLGGAVRQLELRLVALWENEGVLLRTCHRATHVSHIRDSPRGTGPQGVQVDTVNITLLLLFLGNFNLI